MDLNSNGVDMCIGCLALNAVPLDACNSYDGFQGNLYIVDTQGTEDPIYTGLGSRWVLVYLTASEVLLTAFRPVSIPAILQLTDVFTVVAPNAGNFVVGHNLGILPATIEIVPISPAAIWGQTLFADETNLYLTASDMGASAIVLIYTQPVLADVTRIPVPVQVPAAFLAVNAPSSTQFAIAHGLGQIPSLIEILPTSFGWIWESQAADDSNLYFEASFDGVTADITVFPQINVPFNMAKSANILSITSAVMGTFSVPHGLGAIPSRISILMLSGGQIIAQTPAFDGTNVYLSASDVGLVALVSVYA